MLGEIIIYYATHKKAIKTVQPLRTSIKAGGMYNKHRSKIVMIRII